MPYYSELGLSSLPSSSAYSSILLSGPYSTHSSLIASNFTPYSKSRHFQRGYKPHLTPITEYSSPLRRVDSPKISYQTSPHVRLRPIKVINTADIDVSKSKFRKFDKYEKPKEVKPLEKSPSPKTEETEAKPNPKIRRDRATIRLRTIHKDTLERELGAIKSWRDNFQPHELGIEEKRVRKTPGEILKEKFLIRSKSKENLKLERRKSVKKTPSFHDICQAISTDNIVEELNPGQPIEIQRRQSRRCSTDDIIKEISRNSSSLSEAELQLLDVILQEQEKLDASPKEEPTPQKKKITKKKSSKPKEKLPESPPHTPSFNEDVWKEINDPKSRPGEFVEKENSNDVPTAHKIRDISQVDIQQTTFKPKAIITSSVGEIEEFKSPLKAVVEEVEVRETPPPKANKKFKLNFTVDVKEEKSKPKKRSLVTEECIVHVPKPKEAIVSDIPNKLSPVHVGNILKAKKVKEIDRKPLAKSECKTEQPKEIIVSKILKQKPTLQHGSVLEAEVSKSGEVGSVTSEKTDIQKRASAEKTVSNNLSPTKDLLTTDKKVDLEKPIGNSVLSKNGNKLGLKSTLLQNKTVQSLNKFEASTLVPKSNENVPETHNTDIVLKLSPKSKKPTDLQKNNEQTIETTVKISPDISNIPSDVTRFFKVRKNGELVENGDVTKPLDLVEKEFRPMDSNDVSIKKDINDNEVLSSQNLLTQLKQKESNTEQLSIITTNLPLSAVQKETTMNDKFSKNSSLSPIKKQIPTKFEKPIEEPVKDGVSKIYSPFSATKKNALDEKLFKSPTSASPTKKLIMPTLESKSGEIYVEDDSSESSSPLSPKNKLTNTLLQSKSRETPSDNSSSKTLTPLSPTKKNSSSTTNIEAKDVLIRNIKKTSTIVPSLQKPKSDSALQKQTEPDIQSSLKKSSSDQASNFDNSNQSDSPAIKAVPSRIFSKLETSDISAIKKCEQVASEDVKMNEQENERKAQGSKITQKPIEKLVKKDVKQPSKVKEPSTIAEMKIDLKKTELKDNKEKYSSAAELPMSKLNDTIAKQYPKSAGKELDKSSSTPSPPTKTLGKELEKNVNRVQEKKAETSKTGKLPTKNNKKEESQTTDSGDQGKSNITHFTPPKKLVSKRSLINKATKDDPDLEVFDIPEEPARTEPQEEEQKDVFKPLQSNRLSQWMHPWKKPEQYDVCPVEIYAKPKVIRGRHYPRPRGHPAPQVSEEEESDDDEEETEDESSTASETSSTSDDEETECDEGAASGEVGASTSSVDSGFGSGAACNKESSDNRDSPAKLHSNNSEFAIDSDNIPEEFSQSSTFAGFQKTGRITPPATTIPRFRKYCVEDFNFLKVLGKGSFGKVLLAELKGTDYYYAVKCLKKDVVLEDDDVECTLIERKVLALGTKHPYLCHLLCTFQTESHLFFVMEYLNGGDLMFHIQAAGRFPEYQARFYGAEIVSGLKFLHSKGIVYRDLKLDNVLLDFDGHVRIADFGMCKLQIFLDRMAESFCGTPDYMAPEIIKGLHYNQCVDWWSFGVLLYEMLLGQSPFSGCDEDELFWSICNEKPVLPKFLSTEATKILTVLLEKDASKRLGNRFSPHGDIQDHAFFKAIDWSALEARQLEPPFKPHLNHPLDTQYFDKHFTVEKAKLTPTDPTILPSIDQAQFQGFSYTNPNATDK